MINPTQLGLSSLPLGGYAQMMAPQFMGGSMDINSLMLYLQQLMMGQNGANFGSLLNGSDGSFPIESPSFGGGDGGGSSSSDSWGGGLSSFGGAGLGSFLGGSGLGGVSQMMSSLLGGGTSTGSNSGGRNQAASSQTTSFSTPSANSTNPLGGLAAANVTGGSGRIAVANDILALAESGRIGLRTNQVSGVNDNASSYHTISQAASGQASATSAYGHAGGQPTNLDGRMLESIRALAQKYDFDISSIAGGKHSETSKHYAGLAFDVNSINGKPVSANHPDVRAFMAEARALGATEVLGPGNKDHDTHVHVGFDRAHAENGAYTQAEVAEQNQNVKAAQDAVAAASTPEEALAAAGNVDQAVDTRKEAIQEARQADKGARETRDSQEGPGGGTSANRESSSSSSSSDSSSSSKTDSKTSSGSGSDSKTESKTTSNSSSSSTSKSESKSSSDSSSSGSSSSSSGGSSKSKS